MRFKEFFKYKKPEFSFLDLDEPYRFYFVRRFFIAFFLFITAVIFSIYMKLYIAIAVSAIALLIYYGTLIYNIYLSLSDQILIIDGECIDIDRTEFNILNDKDFSFGTCRMVLLTKDNLKINQIIPTASRYKKGDTVRIYFKKGNLNQLNNNTFSVINPIFIHTLSS